MAVELIVTPGATDANSFGTLAEANQYFEERVPISPPWVPSGQDSVNIAAMIMAGRILNGFSIPRKMLRQKADGSHYYVTTRYWTGSPASTTQAMSWCRSGMYGWNGEAIGSDAIPRDLKYAQFELAGALLKADSTLDSDIVVQGITSVKAGSVALTFKDADVFSKVLPDAVINLMPPTWLTDESVSYTRRASFRTY